MSQRWALSCHYLTKAFVVITHQDKEINFVKSILKSKLVSMFIIYPGRVYQGNEIL